MLCPECKVSAPGSTPCPQCGRQVPEREYFAGQGGHYLRLLLGLSILLFGGFFLATNAGSGFQLAVLRLYESGWIWLYLAAILIPMVIGVHYWSVLREEEVIVTDEAIERHSKWGDERLEWSQVQCFRAQFIPIRHTRLGRIAKLSRLFARSRMPADSPFVTYELIGPADAAGTSPCMRLDPGTTADLPWLLELIEEHVGPAQDS
ncbi:MAG: hypothetical protein ACYC4R_04465 [Anaerolineae bacterium]